MEIGRIRHRGDFGERIFELRLQGIHFEDIADIINQENRNVIAFRKIDRYFVEKEYNRIKAIIKKCKDDDFLTFLGGDLVLKKYLTIKKGINNENELREWIRIPGNIESLNRRTYGCLSVMKLI